MTSCPIQDAGTVELYFYDELSAHARVDLERHLRGCRECAHALDELRVIRDALASRPVVDAPPSGNWTTFMDRLDAEVARPHAVLVAFPGKASIVRRPLVRYVAVAAVLALVTLSLVVASRTGRSIAQPQPAVATDAQPVANANWVESVPVDAGIRSVGLRHLERSKLVVLGLAAKEPQPGARADWAYERELASALLADTRLYRLAAEERGLQSLAGVMKDLEIVLLQASMAQGSDATALPQIQRLIRKRGLVEKMDVVGTTGLLP